MIRVIVQPVLIPIGEQKKELEVTEKRVSLFGILIYKKIILHPSTKTDEVFYFPNC